MILEYHRPESISAALALLTRSEPRTVPMGGGTYLNRPSKVPVAVVDVQKLGLDQIRRSMATWTIGSAVVLQSLSEHPDISPALKRSICHQASYNIRQISTIAGTLIASDGRSPLATAMLALDAVLEYEHVDKPSGSITLGNLLPIRDEYLPGCLVTKVKYSSRAQLAYEYVARTPADLPIICVAIARWPSRRTRVVVGGFGSYPTLAMDGPEESGIQYAIREACSQALDEWAGADYRSDVAEKLAIRCIQQFN